MSKIGFLTNILTNTSIARLCVPERFIAGLSTQALAFHFAWVNLQAQRYSWSWHVQGLPFFADFVPRRSCPLTTMGRQYLSRTCAGEFISPDMCHQIFACLSGVESQVRSLDSSRRSRMPNDSGTVHLLDKCTHWTNNMSIFFET